MFTRILRSHGLRHGLLSYVPPGLFTYSTCPPELSYTRSPRAPIQVGRLVESRPTTGFAAFLHQRIHTFTRSVPDDRLALQTNSTEN